MSERRRVEKLSAKQWAKVGIELECWKIPVDLEIRFERERDAGWFRNECRKLGVAEDAIDFKINELEASW